MKSLKSLAEIEKEGIDEMTFDDVIDLNFTTISTSGKEVELVPDGTNKKVT